MFLNSKVHISELNHFYIVPLNRSDLEPKTTKMGKECFDTAFSKITNHWSAKPIKVAKIEKNFTTW